METSFIRSTFRRYYVENRVKNPSYSGGCARTEGLIIDHIHSNLSSRELTSGTFESSQVKNKTPKSTEPLPSPHPPGWAGQDAAQILGKVERFDSSNSGEVQ